MLIISDSAPQALEEGVLDTCSHDALAGKSGFPGCLGMHLGFEAVTFSITVNCNLFLEEEEMRSDREWLLCPRQSCL